MLILFGVLFAYFSNVKSENSPFRDAYFWQGLIFSTIFNVPVVFAALKMPDWMWMYFLQGPRLSLSEFVYVFVFLYYLPYVLGFYLGRDLRRKSVVLWLSLAVVLFLSEAWIIWHLFDRYAVVGTLAQFENGTAVSLFSPNNPLAGILNGSVAAMVLHFILVVMVYRRQKKRRIYQSELSL